MRQLLIALVVLAVCSCDEGGPTGPSGGPPLIRGRVINFITQAPVTGATVQFTNESAAVDARATSTAGGTYELALPRTGYYTASVDGAIVGTVYGVGSAYRGDLFVAGASCVSRFGTVTDAETSRPVAGATVTVVNGTAVTGSDGWYRIDLGCSGPIGSGTTFMHVTHPKYVPLEQVAGRGVNGVHRRDLLLERK